MKTCRHYQVYGHVQGVWFRGSARDKARELSLSGWVRNRPDGAVEAVACGEADALEAFRSWLNEGPPAARVERVEESETEAPAGSGDFEITH